MGGARIFQRGGHTESYRGYSPDCHLNIVGRLLTKRLTKGGSRAPQDPPPPPPWLHPCRSLLEATQKEVPEDRLLLKAAQDHVLVDLSRGREIEERSIARNKYFYTM